jgi:hypothetical protein
MGGRDSDHFKEYTRLCTLALLETRRHAEAVTTLMEIMSHESNFPSFK